MVGKVVPIHRLQNPFLLHDLKQYVNVVFIITFQLCIALIHIQL